MAPAVDGVVVATLAGQTNRKVVAAVMAMLQRVQANVLGVVLNEVTRSMSDGYGYYSHYAKYGKYYQNDGATEAD
jgi:Mrp family chromosome partitioning ATPase